MNIQSIEQVGIFINNHPLMFALIVIWSVVWKLIALWKAVKHNHLTIFIVLGILNTVGVAEIIYLVYLYFKDKKVTVINK